MNFQFTKNQEIFFLGLIFISSNIFYYIIEIQYIYPFLSQLKYPTIALGIGLLTLYLSLIQKIFSLLKLFKFSSNNYTLNFRNP